MKKQNTEKGEKADEAKNDVVIRAQVLLLNFRAG